MMLIFKLEYLIKDERYYQANPDAREPFAFCSCSSVRFLPVPPFHATFFWVFQRDNATTRFFFDRHVLTTSSSPIPPLRAASRSPTATAPARSRCVRFAASKSRRTSSSASCRSSALCVRLRRTLRRTCASRAPPLAPSRRRPRHTSSASLRTPTSAPSTPSA